MKFEPQQQQHQHQSQVGRMIRAQDLSSGKEANIWSSPPPQLPPNGVSQVGAKSAAAAAGQMTVGAGAGPQPQMRNNTFEHGAKASNACLQLFSDNFMSYLNMIN